MTGQSIKTVDSSDWTAERLLAFKGNQRITLCFPCRNEAGTIGPLVAASRRSLIEECPLLDELLVLDDRSTDDTAQIASAAGAAVVHIDTVHTQHGTGHGKGNALWASLVTSTGDLIVWCDGDLTSFDPLWVVRLLVPLLTDPNTALVKAAYNRPTAGGGGGRTTELVARPLLSLLHPMLTPLEQPLAGEFAVRRSMIEQIPFVEGWGVEIAMLIDVVERFGITSVAQTDLGTRHHRHHSLESLSVQAAEVLATTMLRSGAAPTLASRSLTRADGSMVLLNLRERPAAAQLRPTRAAAPANKIH